MARGVSWVIWIALRFLLFEFVGGVRFCKCEWLVGWVRPIKGGFSIPL